MSQELIYTSMPRGLRPGSNGFCTVAMTSGITDALFERLESLSGYRTIYPLGDPHADRNPINYAHWRVAMRDRQYSVLSRVAFAGADYSQRSNKFAHHIVVEPNEQTAAGPAWVLGQPGLMQSSWPGEPRILDKGRPIPNNDRRASRCTAWESITGDAGWAGVLANTSSNEPSKPVYIVYAPGTEVLPLIEEALALLPTSMRWHVTFSTYFTDLPMGATCVWRCVIAGSDAAKAALRSGVRPLPIDLTKPLGQAPDGPLTEAARTGRAAADVPLPTKTPPRRILSAAAPPPGYQPPDGDDNAPAEPLAAPKLRRRLSGAAAAYAVEEGADDLSPLNSADFATERAGANPAAIKKGFDAGLVAILCLVCFIAGGGTVYLLTRLPPHNDVAQIPGPNVTRPKEKNLEERSASAKTATPTPAPDDASPPPAPKVVTPTTVQEVAPTMPPAATNPSLARKSGDNVLAARPTTPVPAAGPQNAQAPPVASSAPAPAAPTASILPPIPDSDWFRTHRPRTLESPVNDLSSKPKQSWQLDPAIDRAMFLFRNGTAATSFSNSRTLGVSNENGAMILKLTSSKGARELGSFKVENGKLNLKCEAASFVQENDFAEARQLFAYGAVIAGNNKDVWKEFYQFPRDTPPAGLKKSITDAADFPIDETITEADILPPRIIWEKCGDWITSAKGNSIVLTKKMGPPAYEVKMSIEMSITSVKGKPTVVRIAPNRTERQALIDGYRKALTDYAASRSVSAGPKEPATHGEINTDLSKCIKDLDDEKKKKEGDRDKSKIANLETKRDELDSLTTHLTQCEYGIPELDAIDGIEVEVCLKNGVSLGTVTFKGLLPKERWTHQ